MNINVLRFDSLASTNTEAANQARRGAGEGLCIVAGQQTAGRGRLGRTWESPPRAGLYFSIILRPKLEMRLLPLITLMAGIAVHDAIYELGIKPDIKWVNDILIGDKKISGILAETVDTPIGMAVILGIGINLTSRHFEADLAEIATSIESETGKPATTDALVASLTKFLTFFYSMLLEPDGARNIVENWRVRSSYFSGKPVRVTLPDGQIEGITDGIEETGSLRLKTQNRGIKIIQAGDVQRLRQKSETDGKSL